MLPSPTFLPATQGRQRRRGAGGSLRRNRAHGIRPLGGIPALPGQHVRWLGAATQVRPSGAATAAGLQCMRRLQACGKLGNGSWQAPGSSGLPPPACLAGMHVPLESCAHPQLTCCFFFFFCWLLASIFPTTDLLLFFISPHPHHLSSFCI